jgi:cytochrome c biogenesis protein CcmG, thiol:disulfide interchange protein DsbE
MTKCAGRALLLGLVALLLLNIVYVVRGWAQITRVATPRGSAAPELTAPLLDGGRFRLADERGHPVVLVFWASWCAPCIAELPGVERVQRKLAQHPTRLYAINTEGDREKASEAAKRLGLTMPIVLDDGSAASAYDVATIPHTVVIDGAGKVAAVLRGMSSEDELWREIVRLEQR